MNAETFLSGALAAVSRNAMVERLFFVSIELTVLAAAVWLLTRLPVVRSPRMAAMLWLAVMVKAIAGLAFAPPISLALLDRPQAVSPRAALSQPARDTIEVKRDAPVETPRALLTPPPSAPVPTPRKPVANWRLPSPTLPKWDAAGWLLAAWAAGAGLLSAYAVVGRIRLWMLVRKRATLPARLEKIYTREARALGLRVVPRLCVSDRLESPAIAGVAVPVVLFPKWLADSGDEEKLTWAARHELMHWKLGDPLAHALRLLVQIVLFFHPVAWWVGRRWEESAERACDRALVRTHSDVVQYAEQLFAMLTLIGARRRRALATGLYATRNSVSARITALLAEPLRVPARVGLRSAIALAVFTLLVVGVGGRFADRTAVAQQRTAAAIVPLAAAPPLPPRTLVFPADRSLGTLRIGNQEVPARGTIQVPAGERVSLNVSDAGVTDLSPLAAFGPDDLQTLYFNGTAVRDEDLANIQHLTGLRELSLSSTGIGDDGMYYLQDLTNLERLILRGTPISDSGMQYLQGMTNMKYLSLNRTEVGDEGMQYLAGMNQLETLDMWQANVSDEGMQYLQNLTNLSQLGLEDTDITDAGLAYLAGMNRLMGLQLESTNVSDEGLAILAKLASLRQLGLEDTNITDEGLVQLAALVKLGAVALPIQIGPEAIAALRDIPAFARLLAERQNAMKIDVTVADASTHQGIAGARFSMEPASGGDPIYFVKTNDRGAVAIYPQNPGAGARIRAFADGYVTAEKRIEGNLPGTIAIALSPAMAIGGIVVDADSNPIAGATVSIPVLGKHNWDSDEPIPHREKTGADGRWTCTTAPQDLKDFWIALDHPDHATTTYTLAQLSVESLRNGSQVLTMADAISLPGYVFDEREQPVSGARIVEIIQSERDRDRPSGRSASTGDDGYFEIANAKPGKSMLRVITREYRPANQPVDVTAGMAPIKIVLRTPGTLRGKVVDQNGKPVANAYVHVQPKDTSTDTGGEWSGQTSGEGKFEWAQAPKGGVRVSVQKPGYRETTVELEAGDAEQVVAIESFLLFKGSVVDAASGEPVKEFAVVFSVSSRPEQPPFGSTARHVRSDDGTFAIDLAADAGPNSSDGFDSSLFYQSSLAMSAAVLAKGYYPSAAIHVEIQLGRSRGDDRPGPSPNRAPLEFRLERGDPIQGRVLTPEGLPVANARVLTASEANRARVNWDDLREPVLTRIAAADAKGRFEAMPERAPFVICVHSDDGYAVVKGEDFKPGGDIVTQPWGTVRLKLGNDVGGEQLLASLTQGVSGYSTYQMVASAGKTEVQFERVMAGECHISVQRNLPEVGPEHVGDVVATAISGQVVDVAFDKPAPGDQAGTQQSGVQR